ncbi:hypothetical protein [Streptomyces sp. SLBN-118]|uniref:hypothetical protein n=1 Tax=Streptomyces sp. SLBN-118 TaxID=2768454 RepID=UPI001151F383|nr:hypothetical protein [Streptomyces sp. SLBN-118]
MSALGVWAIDSRSIGESLCRQRPGPHRRRPHEGLRLARSAALNIVLTSSRAAIVDPALCVVDSVLTRANSEKVKVLGRHDNEWGHSNRLLGLPAIVAGDT